MAVHTITMLMLLAVSHTMARPVALSHPGRDLAATQCAVTDPFSFSGIPTGASLNQAVCSSSNVSTTVTASVVIGTCSVDVDVTSTDGASTGTPGCQSFTRTFTAHECYTDTDYTETATFILSPPTKPTITADPATTGNFACSAGFPTDATVLGTYSAADSCGNDLTVSTNVGTWAKVANACKATAAITYNAKDCNNASATAVTATATYTATGATVTVTPPSSVLTCAACANGAYRTVSSSTTCGSTTVSDWLASASATYSCSSTVGTTPTLTNDFPSAGTNSTVTVTFTGSNDCASDTATKQLKVCPCNQTCSGARLRSKGYWQGGNGGPLCGGCETSSCSGANSATCSAVITGCSGVYGSSTTSLCSCIAENGNGDTGNCWQQLAALYLDSQNCNGIGNSGASTAYPVALLKSKWSTCAYLSGTTATPLEIFTQSLAVVNSQCSNVAGCIGGLLNYYDGVGANDQICTGLAPTSC